MGRLLIEVELSPSRNLNRATRPGTGRTRKALRPLDPIEDLLGCHFRGWIGHQVRHRDLHQVREEVFQFGGDASTGLGYCTVKLG